jgi:hypothetical protein
MEDKRKEYRKSSVIANKSSKRKKQAGHDKRTIMNAMSRLAPKKAGEKFQNFSEPLLDDDILPIGLL